MIAVRAVTRVIGRLLRALGRGIRGGAEPAGIGNTIAQDGDHTMEAIGGAMIVGAGRRFGDAANEGTGTDDRSHDRDRIDRD
jgi:hypothetical protein